MRSEKQITPLLYRIKIPVHELEIIRRLIFDRKDDVPSLWKKITDKNNEVYLTSRENGFLIGALASQRNTVPEFWKQLIDVMNQIKKEACIEMIDLGNNIIQLKGPSGFTITREKYEWE